MTRFWTCQRVRKGAMCRTRNPAVKQRCTSCGGPRPKRQVPAHRQALDVPYETYVEINGGDHCGVCGRPPSAGRRLDRDHDHRTGQPRGLLCHLDNRTLGPHVTLEWLEAAKLYLERAQAV